MKSERVDQLSMGAELFYRRLMSVVDDYGRHYAHAKILRSDCFPLKDGITVDQVGEWLRECAAAEVLSLYEVEGKQYLELADFRQRTRSDSKFPDPPSSDRPSRPVDRQMTVTRPSNDRHAADSCGPITRAGANEGGDGDEGGDGGGVEQLESSAGGWRAPASAADNPEMAELREVLHGLMGPGWRLGPPDAALVRQVRSAAGDTPHGALVAWLVAWPASRSRPPRSFGFWPGAVRDAFAAGALAGRGQPKGKACPMCAGSGKVFRLELMPDDVRDADLEAAIAAAQVPCSCQAELVGAA